MSPRKSVFPLEELCLPFVAVYLKTIVDNHCEKAEFDEDKMAEDLKMVLRYVPPILHDQVADSHLNAVVALFGKYAYSEAEIEAKDNSPKIRTRFRRQRPKTGISKNENESRSLHPDNKPHFHRLMSVFDHLKIKRLTIGDHPAYMERKFSELLDGMTGLEVFYCTHSWIIAGVKAFDFGKLPSACHSLSNLTSFTLELCTDKILSAICDNCRALRVINVKRRADWRNPITDVSIPALVKCENLEMVNLVKSAISFDGFLKFLFETNSEGLSKIDGLEESWNAILNQIEDKAKLAPRPFRTFQLKTLTYRDPDAKQLYLIVKYFPFLTEVLFDCQKPPSHRDFSILSELTRLKSVKIRFHHCNPNDMRDILTTCPSITSIDVRWGKSISELSIWLGYISEFCPDIEILSLHQQEEFQDPENISRVVFAPKSFQKLTKFKSYGSALLDTQQILCQAKNVKGFSFSSPSFLSDEFFETVFQRNLLNQLENLRLGSTGYVGTPHCGISCNMTKQVVANCEQLTDFNIHFPSGIKKEEYSELRQWIFENNYDVDFNVYGLY